MLAEVRETVEEERRCRVPFQGQTRHAASAQGQSPSRRVCQRVAYRCASSAFLCSSFSREPAPAFEETVASDEPTAPAPCPIARFP